MGVRVTPCAPNKSAVGEPGNPLPLEGASGQGNTSEINQCPRWCPKPRKPSGRSFSARNPPLPPLRAHAEFVRRREDVIARPSATPRSTNLPTRSSARKER
jgi:hypothetical protein